MDWLIQMIALWLGVGSSLICIGWSMTWLISQVWPEWWENAVVAPIGPEFGDKW